MTSILNRYIINYFVWWYLVQSRYIIEKIFSSWLLLLNLMNVGPMARNLFKPLYQDYSRMGRIIALPIRFSWVFAGVIVSLIAFPLVLLVLLIYFALPFFPIFGIFSYMLNF